MKHKYVNGPINIVHLRGNIDGIEKDIYLLFDIHNSIEEQNNCRNINIKSSETIEDFIDKIFKNATKDKPVDFMLEIFLSHLFNIYPKIKKEHIYINRLRIFMQQNFTLNKKGTTVISSKIYPNARLHYIDIRDVFIEMINYEYIKQVAYDEEYQNKQISNNTWKNILDKIIIIYNRIKKLHKNITKKIIKEDDKYKILQIYAKISVKKIKSKKRFKMLLYIIKKIKERCVHKIVTNIIDFIINNEISICFNKITNIYNILSSKLINDSKQFFKLVSQMYGYLIEYSMYLMDIYAIRRILDKDYIMKTILYIGYDHACHYIMILMNHLNFKLINISKSNLSKNELTNKIKNITYYKNLRQYIVKENNTKMIQCTDYSMFPNIL